MLQVLLQFTLVGMRDVTSSKHVIFCEILKTIIEKKRSNCTLVSSIFIYRVEEGGKT